MSVTLAAPGGDFVTLTVAVQVDEKGAPKRDQRLFKAGWNSTRKGEFLFDAEAAASVMAAYDEHGVLCNIDLEHLSLDSKSPAFDPDSRGKGRLELRNGELWLCSIDWAPDGEQRIREKRQEYLSPCFPPPGPDGRITEIHNVALVAQPATDFAAPLAASANHRGNTMDPKMLTKCLQALKLVAGGASHEQALVTLAMDVKTIQAVVKAMGGDASGDLGSMFATIQAFAKELADMAAGKAPEADKPAETKAPDAGAPAMMSAAERELQTLKAERDARLTAAEKELVTLKAERDARESVERRELVGQLVVLGRETPATAWADVEATKPRGSLATMPLAELRQRVKDFGGAPTIPGAPRPPSSSGPAMPSNAICEMSEYEAKRLKVLCDRNGTKFDRAEQLYLEHKGQQVTGARSPEVGKRYGRKVEALHCLANEVGRFGRAEFVTLSTPVTPIQDFSGASQRALEEFRVEFLGALASMPEVWAETFGQLLPGGSLRDTYPLDFDAIEYRERNSQGAVASTPESAEITIDKKEFRAAKQAQLRRIQQGDFAYVKTWQSAATTMATARIHLRNRLIATLLAAGDSTIWGVSTKFPSGIDGANFFSATHKVNPFDSRFLFQGVATWLNYTAGATPFTASNLTASKAASLLVPACNGEFVGGRMSHILHPLSLDEGVRLVLTVQDIILDSTGAAGISNEHKGSGFGQVLGAELTDAAAADYYLLSQERIARGMVPWVVAEDAAEEVLTWDESSDFYKDSGLVKVESKIYCNAALIYPHAIRKIKGS